MRKFQDDYYFSVGLQNGLARIGPGRRRLPRAVWQAEKKSRHSGNNLIYNPK
jgi:hypothetical protein